MFAALVGWYTGCERNRRRYPRVKRDFDVEYTLDGARWLFAQGVDLSGGGMCMITRSPILPESFEARIDIEGREVLLGVRKVWGTTTEHRGKESPFYGVQFVRVRPEDWDAIIRSITGHRPSPAERFEPMPLDEGEANTLLPLAFREKMLHELRSRSRIDSQRPQPVVYEYGGLINDNNQQMHQFTVRSSVNGYAGLKRFTTKILVRDDDSEVVVLS